MADYKFVTFWRVSAPMEAVWNEISHPERWPGWWRGVESVERLERGDDRGVGAIYRFTWKGRLPYRLTFDARTVRAEPPHRLDIVAWGQLDGTGVWQLSREGSETVSRYDWKVRTTKRWMELAAPVARPIFAWNHDVLMEWGAEGLAKRLGAEVVSQHIA